MSVLLPQGIDSLRDVPHSMFKAIKAGLIYLSFEELPEDDLPPRNIWTDPEALTEHFTDVRRRNKERFSGREIDDPRENGMLDILIVGDK